MTKKPPRAENIESSEQVHEERKNETEAVFEGEADVLTNRLTSEDNEYFSNEVSVKSVEPSIDDDCEVLTNRLALAEQETEEQITETTEKGVADEEWVTIEESEEYTSNLLRIFTTKFM